MQAVDGVARAPYHRRAMTLRNLGLRAAGDSSVARRVVLGICAIYAIFFLLFYPRTILIEDEVHYTIQARMIAKGQTEIVGMNPYDGNVVTYAPDYPLGTALIMAPFIAIGGESAGHLAALFSLILAVLVLARWLEVSGRSPLFALLVLGYPPVLVLGRSLMSDVPSLAIVTLGLFCFWRGIERGWGWWLASGFLAGASFSFRETNAIVFAPFFAGALLRRDRHTWALVVGGITGLGIRVASDLTIHDVLYLSRENYHAEIETLYKRLPVYALALFVFVPCGLVLGLLYRGRRWPELCTAITLFVAVYLIQRHYSYATSPLKRSILAPRYLIPIVPVIAFAMAESVPRLWKRLLARSSETNRLRLATWAPRVVGAWVGGIALATLAVHPALAWWAGTQAGIHDTVKEYAGRDTVLVTNYTATRKFIDGLDRKYIPIPTTARIPEDIEMLIARHGEITIIFLARSDSPYWRANAGRTAALIAAIRGEKDLLVDRRMSPTDHLQIWRVRSPLRVEP